MTLQGKSKAKDIYTTEEKERRASSGGRRPLLLTEKIN
ncbi:hypothetical protein C427_1618 [Paraglaciecola psychrophila 170]|uniref:Uncharacterized protein n=1 Tax=Paraglaciecola psychrophila 170 TaxID=1129794 RepID=K6YT93_9ALTE|nr:hypothetical protein C427_1618 [Paraglaciecola psychrophila 170]GAC35939.1 hypothetical protein GPSY_0297 [Paraglaciecola psychrophila 170]